MAIKLHNEFLNMYLEYVEDTESPRLFHTWAALSGISACLGRRVHLDFAIQEIFGNQFILLVGPPAVKKSTAINIMKKRLMAGTNHQIRLAQDDTGGQRQGLIVAMQGEDDDEDELDDLNMIAKSIGQVPLDGLAGVQLNIGSPKDKHIIYAMASEFNTFIGQNNIDMVTFLAKMWDGENYEYRIKSSRQKLTSPLVNLIGGTTPTNIVTALPPEAIGQGFMSRCILVHANEKYKSIPRPRQLDDLLAGKIDEVFRQTYTRFDGVMRESPEAMKMMDNLYEYQVRIQDHRFVYYSERRQMHLIKLAMALAATRQEHVITKADVEDAHTLLTETERYMPDALGEFGLSPLATAKQKLVEYFQHVKVPVPKMGLWSMMQKEMKRFDFENCLADLVNSGKIQTAEGPAHDKTGAVYYVLKVQQSVSDQVALSLIEGG